MGTEATTSTATLEAPAPAEPAPSRRPPRLPRVLPDGKIHAVGRRKESVARVYLIPQGSGKVTVNDRPAEEHFAAVGLARERIEQVIKRPLHVTGTADRFDVFARCHGGGVTGQLEAIRLGVARALLAVNPGFKPQLRREGLLTRDPRTVEPKKYGRHKARRSQQFSKR